MTEKARKKKWNIPYIPLLILYIILGVFVTDNMREYYPEVEFAFWVAEVFLVMHAYALCRLPHKASWDDFWGISYFRIYAPVLSHTKKRPIRCIWMSLRIFSASLITIPPSAIVSEKLHLPLHDVFSALLYTLTVLGIALLLIWQKMKWAQNR